MAIISMYTSESQDGRADLKMVLRVHGRAQVIRTLWVVDRCGLRTEAFDIAGVDVSPAIHRFSRVRFTAQYGRERVQAVVPAGGPVACRFARRVERVPNSVSTVPSSDGRSSRRTMSVPTEAPSATCA